MQYRVPQFIEHEAKILGSLTIKQSMVVGGAALVVFFLYFSVGQSNFFLFILMAAAVIGLSLMISFYKVEGRSFPTVVKNWLFYNSNAKLYLWQRKQSPVYLSTERETKKIMIQKEEIKSPLKLRERGRIENLIKKIDFEK